ncbi:PfkB family carbohydrate kinase [Pseudonocardia sp. KRD291]|uniref:PfkB family carbohydrate kinase n=1 Tax=Pseudonocardia sp. KRD291 TaxID=2792007 RepID=UPI001C5C662A|nr:PfkB family carbohydrate kinase [Pseudonocardia sp. KRD291]MBW0102093.1 bifunctional hydroxymethylpyrimidine kinase/phosphomethylpyrimidine kinase [Pseudonocardia sp. KRD291]
MQRSGNAVVVVGAVNVDLVVAARRLPGPGETVVGGDLARYGGGKGANAAVAAARAGATVELLGAVGDDAEGTGAVDELRAEGVGTGGVARLDGVPTGVALIVTDDAGENQIAVGAGANARVDAAAVRAAVDGAPDRIGCVLVSTEIPDGAVVAAVRAAGAAGLTCVLNPAPVTAAVLELLDDRPVLTPNRSELAELHRRVGLPDLAPSDAGRSGAGQPDAGDVASRATALAGRTGAPVVVTLGGDGALLAHPDGSTHEIAAGVARVRDSTGAGDTFNGVLAAGLAAGRSLAEAAATAVTAASLSVASEGARTGMPRAEAIEAALRA